MKKVLRTLLLILFCSCSQDVNTILLKNQKKVNPLIVALEKYYKKYKKYPDTLATLVKKKFIDSIPVLPKIRGADKVCPLSYRVAPDNSFFYLRFTYDFKGYFAPGKLITQYYISYQKIWKISSYPPSFNLLLASYFGDKYKKYKSANALKIAVAALIKTAKRGKSSKCINLSKGLVNKCIGNGKTELPPIFEKAKYDVGEIFSSCDSNCKFCFLYKKKINRPNYGYFLKNPYVTTLIYSLEKKDKATQWQLLEQCY